MNEARLEAVPVIDSWRRDCEYDFLADGAVQRVGGDTVG